MPKPERVDDYSPMTGRAAVGHSGLEVRQVRAFVTLAEQRSLTAAAQILGLAQSTVSESLLALERAVGAQVLSRRRGGHGATLTDAGRALLPHAIRILSAVDGAHAAVAGASKSARGTLQIVASESISTYLLPAVTAQLRNRWPNTRFLVSIAPCQGIPSGIADGSYDVGLLLEVQRVSPGRLTDPQVISRPERRVIATVPVASFAARSHPLFESGARAVVRREALADYPLFVTDATGEFHALLSRLVKSHGGHPSHLESTGSVEGVKRAVMARPGAIGFLPAYAVEEQLSEGSVGLLDPRPALPLLRIDALISPSRVRHPATDDFLQTIVAACSRNGNR